MKTQAFKILEYDKICLRLAELAQSGPGRQLCLDLMPSSDLAFVNRRQEETAAAADLILAKGLPQLGAVRDIRPALTRAGAGARLTGLDFIWMAGLLRTVERLQRLLPQQASPNILEEMIGRLLPAPEFLARIEAVFVAEDELHDSASPELQSLRRRIRVAQNDVKESLARLVRSNERALQEQLVTMRGDRYVVPVKAEFRGEIRGIVHDTSSSGATLFVEPLPVVELNNKIRELMGLERDEIDRIILELSGQAADQADLLFHNLALATELDFILARGRLALAMAANRPLLNEAGRIRLVAARHPLLDKERVVPIDFELGISFKTLVITGPNTGGKTVSLKTCGLFCLMAMAGLQIPARHGSEVSLFEQVLADIGDEQSIEQNLSTFSAHMRNLVTITNEAGPRTLVLTDELGAGTDPTEGAALAIAILDHLRRRGCLTVATTHYKELKSYAIETAEVENASCEFDTETLQPTFRLLIGVPGVSNAFAISGRLGLAGTIIASARSLLSEESVQLEELMAIMQKDRIATQKAHQEALLLRQEAAELQRKLEQQHDELAEHKRQIQRQARQEARSQYARALAEVEEMLQQLRSQAKAADLAHQARLAEQARQEIRQGLGQLDKKIQQADLGGSGPQLEAEDIVLGQTYTAPTLGLTGKVTAGPDSQGRYQLQSEAMQITVPLAALRPARTTGKNSRPAKRKRASLTTQRRMHMQSEIKLLGQTVEEALANLDKFLDDAVLSGISTVRIVHGKGTGALRSAVQQQLRRDSRVQSWRLAAYGEGDSGVTLAELH